MFKSGPYRPPVPRPIYHPPNKPPTAPEATSAPEAPTNPDGSTKVIVPASKVEVGSGPPLWGYLFFPVLVVLVGGLLWWRRRSGWRG